MKRKQLTETTDSQTKPTHDTVDTGSPSSTPRTSRSKGILHKKDLCISCMDPADIKHSRPSSTIQQWNAWHSFKSHTVYIEDGEMRDRILKVIDSTPDPFAAEVRYHRSCWNKYVKPHYKKDNSPEDQMHLQNVRLTEVKRVFFKHVRNVILEMREPRTLQGLLLDYNRMCTNFGFESVTKTSTLKQCSKMNSKKNLDFMIAFTKIKVRSSTMHLLVGPTLSQQFIHGV